MDYFVQICLKTLGVAPVKEFLFHETRKWRFDYAFPEQRVALEVEGGVYTGGRHVNPRGFLGDMEKYNEAAAHGWKVVRCTPSTLCTTKVLEILQRTFDSNKNGKK